jgi:hypothetical protein
MIGVKVITWWIQCLMWNTIITQEWLLLWAHMAIDVWIKPTNLILLSLLLFTIDLWLKYLMCD